MKRSEINALIDDAIALLHDHQVRLPPFAYWSRGMGRPRASECDEIRHCKLGWDITDFGSGDFDKVGLVVFTVRNGHHKVAPYNKKPYAEKILVIQENQHTPMHHHMLKSEDIICKSGRQSADPLVQSRTRTASSRTRMSRSRWMACATA